jgi:hypothetical protein
MIDDFFCNNSKNSWFIIKLKRNTYWSTLDGGAEDEKGKISEIRRRGNPRF